VSFLGVAHELIWFLRGETNIRYLRENKVPIWDAWADSSGELGPIYGKQWRNWVTPEGTTVDQIAQLLRGIREVVSDPRSSWGRRLLLTSWNPGDMPPLSTPTGCHTLAQFNITDGRLSCQMVQRSADVFLGVPYNIASYALLTHILATVCNLQVGEYIHTFGDAHIYENHEEQLRLQLEREPRALPKLRIADSVRASTDLKDLRIDQFSVEGYDPHPAIKGDVAI
jgi:thymidylate synthase